MEDYSEQEESTEVDPDANKPCPFCGEEIVLRYYFSDLKILDDRIEVDLLCDGCLMEYKLTITDKEINAIIRGIWNRRTP